MEKIEVVVTDSVMCAVHYSLHSFLPSKMTRCTAFLSSTGRRCKRTASHDDYCFQHISYDAHRKRCGHSCFLYTDKCCECEDLRPHDQSLYMRYIDGTGGSYAIGCRADGYCPSCKPRSMTSNVTVRSPRPCNEELPHLVVSEFPVTPVRPTMDNGSFTPPPAPRKLRYDAPARRSNLVIKITTEEDDNETNRVLAELRVELPY